LSGEWRILIVLTGMLTIPGWTLLSGTGLWRDWSRLQRWLLAIALSVAVYPVMFYALRSLLPGLALGRTILVGFLFAGAAFTLYTLRGAWRDQVSFDRWDWVVICILGLTVLTRIWIIRDLPYPAWSDGMHHTILTHLTALGGRLPSTLDPYFPIPLNQYHLGFYALSGSAEKLANVPAHTAVLYAAQFLNGLAIVGVFLVLDKMCGRIGAIAGAAIAGLISFQPAFYVNYGRYTQLAAQTVLLTAWLVTWRTVRAWRDRAPGSPFSAPISYAVLAGVLNASVFLLHFRVAALYLPFLGILVLHEFFHSHRQKQARGFLLGVTAIGLVSLLLVSPAVWKALQVYSQNRVADRVTASVVSESELAMARLAYFQFPLRSWPRFAAPVWLLLMALASAVFASLRGSRVAVAALAWTAAMIMIGGAYRINIRLLEIVNMGAVALMLYLPISLALGAGVEEILRRIQPIRREHALAIFLLMLTAASFVGSHTEVMRIEPYRHFVTDGDLAAMTWIRENTPPDALFAINTYFWVPYSAPMGTDGGYWIPYCTGRPTTASCSIFDLGDKDYVKRIIQMSSTSRRLAQTNDALDDLRAVGVRYVYVGVKGNFDGPGFVPETIVRAPGVKAVYRKWGVTILQIQ
jgi:hypothetical protein